MMDALEAATRPTVRESIDAVPIGDVLQQHDNTIWYEFNDVYPHDIDDPVFADVDAVVSRMDVR